MKHDCDLQEATLAKAQEMWLQNLVECWTDLSSEAEASARVNIKAIFGGCKHLRRYLMRCHPSTDMAIEHHKSS